MITLTLLHPVKSSPVQSWSFDQDTIVRVGRSVDNQVVLFSAVVSRHHVELRYKPAATRRDVGQWEIISLGANGTYISGQRIVRSPLNDGLVFRLARSGPNIQVQIHGAHPTERIPAVHVADPSTVAASQVTTPRSEAIAIASERYTQMMEEQGSPQPSPDSLFDLNTGQPLTVHQRIGSYDILKVLGKGDMATTYLGWRNGQTLALKQLNPEWSQNRDAVLRFQQLARQLNGITHPGVPQVIDGFMDGSQPVIAMEMVYGKTLQEEIQAKGPLEQAEAIALALEVCDVLTELHTQPQPIIHGDLHPRHIVRRQMLRSGQEIVLTDFGSVRHYAWALGLSSCSDGYTAPELADVVSHPERVTPALDLYALGTTLAYVLTGEEPGTVYGHHETGHRFQPEYLSNLSSEMVALLQHLTHPDAQQRPQSIADLIHSLRQMI